MERNDYSKLKGRIVERYGTGDKFAEALGITPESLSNKLNNKTDFKQREIKRACSLLKIPRREYGDYFFTYKLQSDEVSATV